ncbi:hypothetical protein [Mangrovicoccus sp. HB161399]|uniref:hypothetical protein n=1 Tax=Mangrovicoccus sp. HB161399 TaxID=2720392 RepID=UPI0015576234|nr:hypothetical protein [Mangrovicoccus sp. HB161399]
MADLQIAPKTQQRQEDAAMVQQLARKIHAAIARVSIENAILQCSKIGGKKLFLSLQAVGFR